MNNETMKLQLIQPWSVPVLKTNLPTNVLQEMIEITDSIIEDKDSTSFGGSLVGQIDTELVIEEHLLKMTGMKNFFLESIRQFVTICHCQRTGGHSHKEDWVSDIIQMWVVSQEPNEYNPLHTHGNCDISAVMYLKVPKILLSRKKDGSDGHIHFTGNVARDTALSSPGITFPPEVGDFYIFGAHQEHSVYPYRCEEGQKDVERRSVSFNAILRDNDIK